MQEQAKSSALHVELLEKVARLILDGNIKDRQMIPPADLADTEFGLWLAVKQKSPSHEWGFLFKRNLKERLYFSFCV